MNNKTLTRRSFITAAAVVTSQFVLPGQSHAIETKKNKTMKNKLDIDYFIADCIEANKEMDAQIAIKEVLTKAVSRPKDMLAALGEPNKAGINILHASKTLTIFNASWTPQMNLLPHSHLMWALIGIYTGREDNILWRRDKQSINAYGVETLFEGDVAELADDVIHSVTNPLQRFTGGLHIYGGDFFHTTRSQWNPDTLIEEPSDGDTIKSMFTRENKRYNLAN
ncbi:MAG: hypothetical protein JKY19_05480 [Alcanivoracaceae bacterium]|nr:hypothetical protein [Alcanivoracaceae bacterium]